MTRRLLALALASVLVVSAGAPSPAYAGDAPKRTVTVYDIVGEPEPTPPPRPLKKKKAPEATLTIIRGSKITVETYSQPSDCLLVARGTRTQCYPVR